MSAAALFDYGFAVGPMVPASVKTVPDFLEWCKANPTQANFGSPAAGSSPHFIGALLGKAGQVDLQHIAFRGTQPAVLDLMGGQIAAVSGPSGDFAPHVAGGKVRVIGTSGPRRGKFTPNIATPQEQGFKDMAYTEWFGFFLPASQGVAGCGDTPECRHLRSAGVTGRDRRPGLALSGAIWSRCRRRQRIWRAC